MFRGRNTASAGLAAMSTVWVLTGCVAIKDRTPTTVERASDGRYLLSASVETFGTQPRNVRAAIGSSVLPMTDVGGGNWQVSTTLDPCLSTFQLRFLVDYTPAIGTTATEIEPPATTPATGGLLKTVSPLKNCGPSQVLRVNSEEYLVDSAPGDGNCDASPPGTGGTPLCTLRAAINEANARPGAATILVPAGHYATPSGDYFIPQTDMVIQGDDRDSVTIGQISIIGSASVTAPTVEIRSATLPFGVRSQVGSLSLSNVMVADAHPSTVDGAVQALGLLSIENSSILRSGPNGVHFSGSHARITNSLIASNGEMLGGVVCAPSGSSELEVVNSTITDNRGLGGVIIQDGCSATFRNATIAGNTISRSPGSMGAGGGLSVSSGATVILSNSILADNSNRFDASSADCSVFFRSSSSSSVTIQSLGNNLIGTAGGSCRFNSALGRPDLVGLGASLAGLADNGGPTQTRVPLPGSPALGRGATDPYNDAFPAACPHADQRGLARSGACTVGAAQP
jgi:CSLREA domain-containing protein